MEYLDTALAKWRIPELPAELGADLQDADMQSISRLLEQRLSGDIGDNSPAQIAVAEWLYYLVRSNVRRGRIFDLEEVLATGRADCLGYAKLFSALGEKFGLELGIVEVLIDNMGRYVPHHVNLLNLYDETHRFIDAWYGSPDISHRRIGALVEDKPRDIDREELAEIKDLKGLPDRCIEAITLYVRGNRFLERAELHEAIQLYSEAVMLYPDNSRAFYNRALAHEIRGALEAARSDYNKAFRDDASIIRILARVDELEQLIKLDEEGVSEEKQDMYLWHKGFKTGVPAGCEEIAQKYRIPLESVEKIIGEVESICSG